MIEDNLSEELLKGTFKEGDEITAELDENKNVVFKKNKISKKSSTKSGAKEEVSAES